jgi:hypothetical protein
MHVPRAANLPPSSYGLPSWRVAHASINAFAGPQSKPRTSLPSAGRIVMLLMPPRLQTTRVSPGAPNTVA